MLAFWVVFWADRLCALSMFQVSFYYYSCTYVPCYHHYQIEQRVPPSTVLQWIDHISRCSPVVVILTRVSCISHQLLSSFLELCHTISTDIVLTWMTFSDQFQVSYHYTYTLILPHFQCKKQVTLSSHYILSYTVVFVVWFFRPYRHCSCITGV